jgi:hypothetical protein
MATAPLIYQVFFLYIDPLLCLSGIYLSFADQSIFIQNGVPSALKDSSSPLLPPRNPALPRLVSHFMFSIGSYSIGIFALQILLLHQFSDTSDLRNLKLWKILQFSILTIDLGLLYGVIAASPRAFLDMNNGILGVVAMLRTAFILGLGF